MANGRFTLGKQSGGTLGLVFPDGVSNTEVVLPESGNLVTKEYADTKQSKAEVAYNVDTSSYIPNTLTSGAVIERGSNANGEYVKYTDGTLICKGIRAINFNNVSNSGVVVTFPHNFVNSQYSYTHVAESSGTPQYYYIYPAVPVGPNGLKTTSQVTIHLILTPVANITADISCNFMVIGRWK